MIEAERLNTQIGGGTMTVAENLAHLFPLHYQRIVELTNPKHLLEQPSRGRWTDLAGLFLWDSTEEGHDYWSALATGEGLRHDVR